MQEFTYHTHNNSQGIADGRDSCEDMIAKAEELGFKEIGVSNHFIYHPNTKNGQPMDFTDLDKALDYACKDIEQTREVAAHHKIKVRAGFEVDYYPSAMWRNAFEKMLKATQPDYLIGSSHNAFSRDEEHIFSMWHLPTDRLDNETLREYVSNYWQNVIGCINSGYFDFIAHFDLPINLGCCAESEWCEHRQKVVEAFKKTKHPFEINTKGLHYYGAPSPDWGTIKELVEAKVPVLISDDAHTTEMLGQHFAEAEDKLAEFGCVSRFHL